jgi:Ca-activated chloride channel family protein
MVDINAQIDYYAVLGVPDNVMPNDIKFAYRELARIFHPDVAEGDADKFRQIQEAYNVLSDPVYRRTYDQLREARGYKSTPASPIKLDVFQNRDQLPILDGEQVFYVIMDIVPDKSYVYSRQRLNIALVIDCSTSMHGPRMHNVKMAASDLLNALREDDYLSIVSFNDRAVVEASANQVGNKRSFLSVIAALAPGGGTEIYQGLLAGFSEIARYANDNTINHVLLLTDGRTYGDEELALNETKRAFGKGIGISTFGIGEDWNDLFLDKLAQQGGGISQYIDTPNDIQVFLKERIQDLSNVVARRLKFRLNTAPYVYIQSVYRAHPHMESIPVSNDNVVSIGDVSSDEPIVLVLAVVIKNSVGEMGDRRILRIDVQAEKLDRNTIFALSRDIHITFTEKPADTQVPARIFNILSRLSVFQLQEKAWNALEGGEVSTATNYLESAATHLFDMGYVELARAAMLEADRISSGDSVTNKGRKQIRYGTRSLALDGSIPGGGNDAKR